MKLAHDARADFAPRRLLRCERTQQRDECGHRADATARTQPKAASRPAGWAADEGGQPLDGVLPHKPAATGCGRKAT